MSFLVILGFFMACNGSNLSENESIEQKHYWTRTNPGGGGALAMAGATASGTLLVASDLSGIYRSFDKGKSWDVLGANNGLIETHISALGFHTSNGNIFFAGTGDGLYRTTNGGKNFSRLLPNSHNDYDVEYIESVVVAMSNPKVVYVTSHLWNPVTKSSIYRSDDTGISWREVLGKGLTTLKEEQHIVKLLVHPLYANVVYALTGKSRWGCSKARVYKSIDGGENWEKVGGNSLKDSDILDMDIDSKNINRLYVTTFEANECPYEMSEDFEYVVTESEKSGFYKIVDNRAEKLTSHTGIISVGIENPNIIRLVDILLPYDWNEDAGTWESKDAGKSWKHTGFVNNWNKGYTNNQYFAYGSSFNGLTKTLTKDIFNSNNFYGTFGQWAWASFDGGEHIQNISTKKLDDGWISTGVDNINGHCLDVSNSNPNIVYMGGYDIGFWYSKNHGKSWNRTQPDYRKYSEYVWNIDDEPSSVPEKLALTGEGTNVTTLLNDPQREGVVWASFGAEQSYNEGSTARRGLFKSKKYGKDWKLLTQGLPIERDKAIRFYGLSLDINSPKDNRTLYVTIKGNVYKSIDDGSSWKMIFLHGGLKFTEVDRFDFNLIYAGGEAGLWRSIDAGKHWKEVGLSEMRATDDERETRADIIPTYSEENIKAWEGVFDIETDVNVKNRVYVTAYGKGKGLYRSDDRGVTWKKLITDDHMRSVATTPKNSNILYATSSEAYHSGGVGNSKGVLYSKDAGANWKQVNENMAWNYAGKIEVERGDNPNVWVWSPGTGVEYSLVP